MYSFGMTGPMIWTMHIIIGLILMYIGYVSLNNQEIKKPFVAGLLIIGSMAVFYHAHLFYYYTYSEQNNIQNKQNNKP